MYELSESERQTLIDALNAARGLYMHCASTFAEATGAFERFNQQMQEVSRLRNLLEEAETIQIEEPEPDYLDEPRDHPVDQMDYAWNEPGAPFTYGDY